MTAGRTRCRCCRKPLRDRKSRLRRCGPCCWKSLTAEKREAIEAGLPREFRPQRLQMPRIPFPRRRRPDPAQPALFDLDDIPEDPAAEAA